jgi:hypothetical protein
LNGPYRFYLTVGSVDPPAESHTRPSTTSFSIDTESSIYIAGTHKGASRKFVNNTILVASYRFTGFRFTGYRLPETWNLKPGTFFLKPIEKTGLTTVLTHTESNGYAKISLTQICFSAEFKSVQTARFFEARGLLFQ